MPTAPSKYASNQFEVSTRERFPLMSEVLLDAFDHITAVSNTHPDMDPALTTITATLADWNAGETLLANAEASQMSATATLNDKMASLTRKPDINTNSLLESWDLTIRAVAPVGGTVYTLLLPHGRETVTGGPIDEQIDALRDFGQRLSQQTGQATLVTLGNGTVTPFATAARTLRTTQGTAMAIVEVLRSSQEALRVAAAAELYAMVGLGMQVFKANPLLVDDLFDVNLLRAPAQAIPAPPADTAWDFPTRTLSTTALPASATRLEAWRQGEGGAPERLAVGEPDELTVHIPAMYTFDTGEAYDLWLTARNSKGTSGPGPVVVFTAP